MQGHLIASNHGTDRAVFSIQGDGLWQPGGMKAMQAHLRASARHPKLGTEAAAAQPHRPQLQGWCSWLGGGRQQLAKFDLHASFSHFDGHNPICPNSDLDCLKTSQTLRCCIKPSLTTAWLTLLGIMKMERENKAFLL